MKHVFNLLTCKGYLLLFLVFATGCRQNKGEEYYDIASLREVYSQSDTSLWPEPELDSLVDLNTFKDIGPLSKVKFPKENPFSEEKKKLGKLLFFDPRLSQSGQIACASCHNPELSWTDQITRSFGHNRQLNKRNSMPIKNTAYAEKLFWDGRASSLEHQAMFPIEDPKEMNNDLDTATQNIANVKGYASYFEEAFGDSTVTTERISKAIATYERTIVSRNSRFDRFVKGKKEALTDQQVLGLHLFRTKAHCINCHNTPYFSDGQFHNDGQTLWGSKHEDLGLYHQTKKAKDVGKFKTPTLREVSKTGPWMHHGHFPTMLDVLQFYNLGNPAPIQKRYLGTERDFILPKTSPILQKLELTDEEIEAVIAFLESLSTANLRVNTVRLPE